MDSTDTSLQYVSVYNADTGERETSYVVSIHGATVDELKALAAKNYPKGVVIEQDGAAWNNAVQELTSSTKRASLLRDLHPRKMRCGSRKLAALDSEYSRRFLTLKPRWQRQMPSAMLIILTTSRPNMRL